MHVDETQTFVRFARLWQDFVCPCFAVILWLNARRCAPVRRFSLRQLCDQLLLWALDRFASLFSFQIPRQRRKQREHRIAIPITVQLSFFRRVTATRRKFQNDGISALIFERGLAERSGSVLFPLASKYSAPTWSG